MTLLVLLLTLGVCVVLGLLTRKGEPEEEKNDIMYVVFRGLGVLFAIVAVGGFVAGIIYAIVSIF